jgi:hypothetical protein
MCAQDRRVGLRSWYERLDCGRNVISHNVCVREMKITAEETSDGRGIRPLALPDVRRGADIF